MVETNSPFYIHLNYGETMYWFKKKNQDSLIFIQAKELPGTYLSEEEGQTI